MFCSLLDPMFILELVTENVVSKKTRTRFFTRNNKTLLYYRYLVKDQIIS